MCLFVCSFHSVESDVHSPPTAIPVGAFVVVTRSLLARLLRFPYCSMTDTPAWHQEAPLYAKMSKDPGCMSLSFSAVAFVFSWRNWLESQRKWLEVILKRRSKFTFAYLSRGFSCFIFVFSSSCFDAVQPSSVREYDIRQAAHHNLIWKTFPEKL